MGSFVFSFFILIKVREDKHILGNKYKQRSFQGNYKQINYQTLFATQTLLLPVLLHKKLQNLIKIGIYKYVCANGNGLTKYPLNYEGKRLAYPFLHLRLLAQEINKRLLRY